MKKTYNGYDTNNNPNELSMTGKVNHNNEAVEG